MTRRCTHGTRNSRVHWALAAHARGGRGRGSGPTVDRLEVVLDADRVEHGEGHVGVAVRAEVHPVGVHDAGDRDVAHPPQVDDVASCRSAISRTHSLKIAMRPRTGP